MCKKEFSLETSRKTKNNADINHEVVSGLMSLGNGYTHLQTILACLDLPSITFRMYRSLHDTVCSWWQLVAEQSMTEAARLEADYAKSIGSVNSDGVPMITVVADGCWSKRSYGSSYNALSGAAAIIGHYTGKVLYLGVKNKFCSTCSRAGNKGSEPPTHDCYKNYEGSSSAMESTIISEGFRCSLSAYGLIYSTMIADGDSNTYAQIRDKRPYKDLTVAKINCKNHLLRNYCKALLALSADTRLPVRARKFLKQRYLRFRFAVDSIIKHWKSQNLPLDDKVKMICKDILNSPYHIFGDHSGCASYFCSPETRARDEDNLVTELSVSGFFPKICEIVTNLSKYSNSFVHNVTSNTVESFNAQVAKYVGGKRVNYSLRNSYMGRCYAAVVSFNTGSLHSATHKFIFGRDSNPVISELESSIRQANKRQKSKAKRVLSMPVLKDASYGKNCEEPDMDDDVYEVMKEQFLKGLVLTAVQRQQLERNTVSQSDSQLWLESRRKLLTASWFANVCKKRASTDCKTMVKQILYGRNLDNVPSIKYGKRHEQTAITQLSSKMNIIIESCGLFVDKEFPFLGASPDGMFDGGIVEVKCPSSAANCDPEVAILERKIKFWKIDKNGKVVIDKSNAWFFQIQGQLHITGCDKCVFGVWTGDNIMKVEVIERDDQFWKENMEPRLVEFYRTCLLPELVDSRYGRSMEIRSHTSHS